MSMRANMATKKRDIVESVRGNGTAAIAARGHARVAGEVGEPDTTKLARLIGAYAPHDGSFAMRVPGLFANRITRINPECVHALGMPVFVDHRARGEDGNCGAGNLRVRPYEDAGLLRGASRCGASDASKPSEPYFSLRLDIEPQKIAELVLIVFPHGLPPVQERRAVYITELDTTVVNAAIRLMECLARPGDAELLGPLGGGRDLSIRLLRSPIGVRVAQMGFAESSVQRIAKAISWLRANYYSQPMKVRRLADL